jgi:hypothetical protein
MARTMTARARSAAIITRRRLARSFTMPAAGATKNCGRTCNTTAMAMERAVPVSRSSSE